ncbi:MAG: hypothetical protein PHZ03_03685 [Syntrophomonas sp.]|nr:hypothetical protein [Syntrophomonas sp.]
MEINRMQYLLNKRQNLLNEQEVINLDCYEIDIRLKRIRNYYAMQIERLKIRMDACDDSAVIELKSLFNEFREDFQKPYYKQLKLRRKSEQIQYELFKITDAILK